MGPMYEEKGWEKDKVMTQANKKDKDRGGRLRSQVWGLHKEKSAFPFFFLLPSHSLLVCPSGEFREKYKGFVPPFRKLDFFLLNQIEQKSEWLCSDLVSNLYSASLSSEL